MATAVGACGEDGPSEIVEDDCEDNEDCDDGEICNDDGECVVEEEPGPDCTEDSDCPFSAQMCIDEECEFVTRQCSSVGQECDPDEPVASGFACEDVGFGTRCYETCGTAPTTDPLTGEATVDRFCNRHEGCVEEGVDEPVCRPRDCESYHDTEEGCSERREVAEQKGEQTFAQGEHCVQAGNETFFCEPAGTSEAGEACDATPDCAEGLTCIDEIPQGGFEIQNPDGSTLELPFSEPLDEGFCAPVCDGDDECSDGQQCIGDDIGFSEGLGFCGDRCEPFGTDEERCEEEKACVPISSEDGLCHRETTRERGYYEECETTSECPDSAHCVGLALDEPARCAPLCDPTLETDDERAATCPVPNENRALGGDCFDLAPQLDMESKIGTAFCMEACRESEDWGVNGCTGQRACEPSGGEVGMCEPSGDAEFGETCTGPLDCVGGLHCDMTGDGTGTCRSMCQPDEQTSDEMTCEDGEVCIPLEGPDNVGKCRIPCEDDGSGSDPDCPEHQQSCRGVGDDTFCSGSGDKVHEDECGDPSVQNCLPGLVCATNAGTLEQAISAPFSEIDSDDEPGTCRQTCEPFVGEFGDSGCPSGYACSPMTPEGMSRTSGHCVEEMEAGGDSLTACPQEEVGKMCNENSFCVADEPGGSQTQCLQFCNYETGTGCTGATECDEGFADGPLFGWLGICLTA